MQNQKKQLGMMGLCSLASVLLAQVQPLWVRRYDGPARGADRASKAGVDSLGNVVVAGTSSGDYLTIKYSPEGESLWAARYSGPVPASSELRWVAVNPAGNTWVTGYTTDSTTGRDYTTIKYGPSGNEEWVRRLTGTARTDDEGYAVAADSAGNSYVTGSYYGGMSEGDCVTLKYDSLGDEVWRDTIWGKYQDAGTFITLDSRGFVSVAGWYGFAGRVKGYLGQAFEPDPAHSVALEWTGRIEDRSPAIGTDASGNIYVVCAQVDTAHESWMLVKFNRWGDPMWTRYLAGTDTGYCAPCDLVVARDNSVYVTGWARNTNSGNDCVTAKYDTLGDTLWVRTYDGPEHRDDAGLTLALDDSQNVYVAGQTTSSEDSSSVLVISYKPDGTLTWWGTYDGADSAVDVVADRYGGLYVVGTGAGGETELDYVILKYDQTSTSLAEKSGVSHRWAGSGLTMLRGVLYLSLVRSGRARTRGMLHNVVGQEVLALHPGANDLSRLAPGVYFYTLDNGAKRISRKVILTE